jgi:hypothetical protein
MPSTDSRDRQFRSAAIIIIAATLLVMGRLCFNDFVSWDDNRTVSQNPKLNPPTIQNVEYYWAHFEYRIYAPLTYTLWAVLALAAHIEPDRTGIALNPLIFHAANVLLHLLAALVVCRILFLMRMHWFAAMCGSLIFAIHPLQVEAVAWVSGMKDLLSGLLALVALWQYLEFALADREGRRHWTPLALCIASMILAMFAKSAAATLPLAAVAIDRWILHRPWKSICASASLLVVVAIPFAVVASMAQVSSDLAPIPLWPRPLIVGDSLTFYLHKLVWPIKLCLDYGRTPWAVMRLARHPGIYVEMCIPLALGLSLFLLRKRAQTLIAAALVFVAGCLPTLGLATFATQFFSTTADHYLYWAMLGPAIAVAWVLTAWPDLATLRVGVIAAICVLGILSIRQGGFWQDDFSLMEHTAAVNPRSFVAFNNLGNAYYAQSNPARAAEMFRRAIEARSDYSMAHSNLAAALRQLGQLDESTAELKRSIALQRPLDPRLRQSWVQDLNHLGQNLLEQGKPASAAAALRESLDAKPNQPQTIDMLARAAPAQQIKSDAIQPSSQTAGDRP